MYVYVCIFLIEFICNIVPSSAAQQIASVLYFCDS